MESMRQTRQMDLDIVLPGHGEPFTDHAELIDKRFALHQRRAEKLHGADRRAPPHRLRAGPGAVGQHRRDPGLPDAERGAGPHRPAAHRRPRGRGRGRRRRALRGGSVTVAHDRGFPPVAEAETQLERAEAAGRAPAARPGAQEADAGDREPLRDHGLRPPAQPRGLRAGGPLRGGGGGHREAQSRHPDLPRGRLRGLRRGGGLRRRRHGERGRQRAGGVGHAADLPARRGHQRLPPRDRHPHRRGGRHRAPAAAGRRLPPPPGGPGPDQRPLLHVLRRRGPGRQRGRAGGRPPAPEGPPGRVLLHVLGHLDVQPPLPGQPPARAGRRWTARSSRGSR